MIAYNKKTSHSLLVFGYISVFRQSLRDSMESATFSKKSHATLSHVSNVGLANREVACLAFFSGSQEHSTAQDDTASQCAQHTCAQCAASCSAMSGLVSAWSALIFAALRLNVHLAFRLLPSCNTSARPRERPFKGLHTLTLLYDRHPTSASAYI